MLELRIVDLTFYFILDLRLGFSIMSHNVTYMSQVTVT